MKLIYGIFVIVNTIIADFFCIVIHLIRFMDVGSGLQVRDQVIFMLATLSIPSQEKDFDLNS
jgi:hypothetical protein